MNKEQIIRMAREAGWAHCDKYSNGWMATMERFATLVAAAKEQEHKDAMRWDVHSCGPTCKRYAGVAIREAVAADPLRTPPPPSQPEQDDNEREKEIADMRASRDFYKRRVEALQQWQSKMRDPERTVVCDIIANGHTLEPAGDRYITQPPRQPEQAQPVAWVDAVMEQAQVFASAWSLVGSRLDNGSGMEDAEQAKAELRALLTAPPPRQPEPLTDEQFETIWHDFHDREFGYAIRYARAIEAAHGITKGEA